MTAEVPLSGLTTRIEEGWSYLIDEIRSHTSLSINQSRCLCIAGAGLGTWILWKHLNRPEKLPPGPPGYPIIGNAIDMWKEKDFVKTLHKYSKDYGPLYTFYMGPKPVVIIGSAELLRDAYLRNSMVFAERPRSHSGEIISNGGKDILGAPQYDTRLQVQRKLAFAALRNYATGLALEGHVSHAFEQMCKEIEKKNGANIEAMDLSHFLTYNILASMTFGKKFEIDDPFLNKIMDWQKTAEKKFNNPIYVLVFFLKFAKYLPLKIFKEMKEFIDTFMGYLQANINEHKEKFNEDNLNDFTDFMLHEMKIAENDSNERNKLKLLDEEHFNYIIFDLFLAGTETTRATLSWIWLYLAAFPEVQQKAQEEIESILGEDGKVTVRSRDQLGYVDAVIHEVMRIRPIAPLTVRQTTEQCELGGYVLPKGCMVMGNTYSIHYDESEWREPEAFLPERWLDESGQYIFQEKGFMAFSLGRRSCIGESFAKLQLHMLTVFTLQKYNIKSQDGYQIKLDPRLPKYRPISQVLRFEKRL